MEISDRPERLVRCTSQHQVPNHFRVSRLKDESEYSSTLISRDKSGNVVESSWDSWTIARTHLAVGSNDVLFSCAIRKTELSPATHMCTVSASSSQQSFSLLTEDGEAIIKPLSGYLQAIFPFRGGLVLQTRGDLENVQGRRSSIDRFYFLVSALSALTEIAIPTEVFSPSTPTSPLLLSCVYESESLICITHSACSSVILFYLVERVVDGLKSKPSPSKPPAPLPGSNLGISLRKSTSRSLLSSPSQSFNGSLKKSSSSKLISNANNVPLSLLKTYGYSSPTQTIREEYSEQHGRAASVSSRHSSQTSHSSSSPFQQSLSFESTSAEPQIQNFDDPFALSRSSLSGLPPLPFGIGDTSVFAQSQTLPSSIDDDKGIIKPMLNYNSHSSNNINSDSNTNMKDDGVQSIYLDSNEIKKQRIAAEFALRASCRPDVLFNGATNVKIKIIGGRDGPLSPVILDVWNKDCRTFQRFSLKFREIKAGDPWFSCANISSSETTGKFILSAAEDTWWPAALRTVVSISYSNLDLRASYGNSAGQIAAAIQLPLTVVISESSDYIDGELAQLCRKVSMVLGFNTIFQEPSDEITLSLEDSIDVLQTSQILTRAADITLFSLDSTSGLSGLTSDGVDYIIKYDILDSMYFPNQLGFRSLMILIMSRVRNVSFSIYFITLCSDLLHRCNFNEKIAMSLFFQSLPSFSQFKFDVSMDLDDNKFMNINSSTHLINNYVDSLKTIIDDRSVSNGIVSIEDLDFLVNIYSSCSQSGTNISISGELHIEVPDSNDYNRGDRCPEPFGALFGANLKSVRLRYWEGLERSCTPAKSVLEDLLACTNEYLSDVANVDLLELESVNYEQIAKAIVDSFIESTSSTDSASIASRLGLFPHDLQKLIEISVLMCQCSPGISWPQDLLTRNGRIDLLRMRTGLKSSRARLLQISTKAGHRVLTSAKASAAAGVASGDCDDGLVTAEDLSVLRFNRDERVHEVGRMLRSSATHYLRVDKSLGANREGGDASDQDHRNKIQMRLLTLCRRSLACPVGRGMLTLASIAVPPADALGIPELSITGRVAPHYSIISLDTSAAPPELTLWPEFHNGVATGLRIRNTRISSTGASTALLNLDRYGGIKSPLQARLVNQGGRFNTGNSNLKFSSGVSRNWILYNKLASISKQEESSHAGLLLALGLQGHLGVLSIMDILEYATKQHDPTTIAILLGCAASKLGSADSMHSKTLTLHIPSLLPSRVANASGGVPLSAMVQAAALTGLGLLHCGSAHRLMVEYLLSELTRAPSSDRVETREALSLAASWSLGMILLGRCSGHKLDMKSLSDLAVEDRLQLLIEGGQRPADSVLFPSLDEQGGDSSSRTSRILETDAVNSQVTAPGAIIALAMLHMKSNFSADKNFSIGECSKIHGHILGRLAVPVTVFALSKSRPDILFHRALGLTLVLWDAVVPTKEWIESQIPAVIRESLNHFHAASDNMSNLESKIAALDFKAKKSSELPYDVVLTTHICIFSGYCLGLGLIYAGTMDPVAKNTVSNYLKVLQSYRDNKFGPLRKGLASVIPGLQKLCRGLIEMCTCSTAIALSLICAGSGDVDALRIIRELRWKVDDVLYGSHMALGMALGFLFLSGGDASLKRDPVSISCLLLSVLPRYPSRTVDNQFHLQPLRHFYVLAVESRALYALDADSLESVSVTVVVTFRNGGTNVYHVPTLLPELSSIQSIRVDETDKYFQADIMVATEYDSLAVGQSPSLLAHSRYSLPPLYLRRKQTCNVRQPGTLQKLRLDRLVKDVTEDSLRINEAKTEEGVHTISSTNSFSPITATPLKSPKNAASTIIDNPKVQMLLHGGTLDFYG